MGAARRQRQQPPLMAVRSRMPDWPLSTVAFRTLLLLDCVHVLCVKKVFVEGIGLQVGLVGRVGLLGVAHAVRWRLIQRDVITVVALVGGWRASVVDSRRCLCVHLTLEFGVVVLGLHIDAFLLESDERLEMAKVLLLFRRRLARHIALVPGGPCVDFGLLAIG